MLVYFSKQIKLFLDIFKLKYLKIVEANPHVREWGQRTTETNL
jgi:hypothetical protein